MVARASDPAKRPRGWTLHTLPADEVLLPETPQSGPEAVLEASTDLCGRLLGARYDVKELLSHGERGAVYLAHDRNYGRSVVLRLAAPRAAVLGGEDVRTVARRRMGVRHPHLAAVQGEGLTEGGLHYVAMEHVEGRNLHHMLGDPRLRWPAIHTIGVQVAEALVALHGAWVVHGDVHPGNLMWVEDPERSVAIKLVDLDVGERPNTSPYLPAGFYGERDSTSDVYALVASLYELSTGAAPEPMLAALPGQADLPEWFAQLLRSVLRTNSGIPSARGLLASLRQGGQATGPVAGASAPSGPRFMRHAPSGPLPGAATATAEDAAASFFAQVPSGPVPGAEDAAASFFAQVPSGPLRGSHVPAGPLFEAGPAPSAVQVHADVPAPVVHASSVPLDVPMPVAHARSVPVPVVRSASAIHRAAQTEDELWFAAVAEFDPLQRLESMAAEAEQGEPEAVKVTDLEPPPPFERASEDEVPAMVTMQAAFDPRPSPVLGVPVDPSPEELAVVIEPDESGVAAPARPETSAEATASHEEFGSSVERIVEIHEEPAPLSRSPEYEATAEINLQSRPRAILVGAVLLGVALLVWLATRGESPQPAAPSEPTPGEQAAPGEEVAPAKVAAPPVVAPKPASEPAVPAPAVAPEAVTPEAAAPEADTAAAESAPLEDADGEELDATAPPGVADRLGAGEFRQILLRANRSPATIKCYMQHTAGVEQKVEVVVKVSARGKVQRLRIDDGPLGNCLKQVVERLSFPRARRSAQHQFVFKSPIQE